MRDVISCQQTLVRQAARKFLGGLGERYSHSDRGALIAYMLLKLANAAQKSSLTLLAFSLLGPHLVRPASNRA